METAEEFIGRIGQIRNIVPERMTRSIIHEVELRDTALLREAAERQWISVEERLPEEGQEVLLTGYRYNNPENGRYTIIDTYDEGGRATHWQPIPPPPAGKEGV